MLLSKAKKTHFGEGLYSTIETKYHINNKSRFFVLQSFEVVGIEFNLAN